jgi:HD superfamily phosphohydrolase YqeK
VTDYFGALATSGDPAADVLRFYQAVGRLDTLEHVTRVAAEARALAEEQSENVAALAHDLASVVPVAERPAVAQQMGVDVSEADRAMPALLHGPIAAAALAQKLGLLDEEVLDAVRYHSKLRAAAGMLEALIFLAGKLAYDPRSVHCGEYLPAPRAADSLEQAALVYLGFSLDNTWRYGWYLHSHAMSAYRDLLGQVAR